jgi:hypothetical protein
MAPVRTSTFSSICAWCGEPFTSRSPKSLYCRKGCKESASNDRRYREGRRANRGAKRVAAAAPNDTAANGSAPPLRRGREHHLTCVKCGEPFTSHRSDTQYCRTACKSAAATERRRKAGKQVSTPWEPKRGYLHDWNPAPSTVELIDNVEAVLNEYAAQLPLSLRQIYYRLIAKGQIEKSDNSIDRLSYHVANARRAGRIPFGALRDDTATDVLGEGGREGDMTPEGYMGGVKRKRDALLTDNNYHRGAHERQPAAIDLWCESAGMVPQLSNVVAKYGVCAHSGGGFDSVTSKWEFAQEIAARDVPTVVLHVGDFDEAGHHIFDAFAEDVEAFCATDGGDVEVHRIAVTREQIEEYGLPSFKGAVQAEALPPDELARIVEEAVLEHYDEEVAAEVRRREKKEREVVDQRLAELRYRDVHMEAVRRAFGWENA